VLLSFRDNGELGELRRSEVMHFEKCQRLSIKKNVANFSDLVTCVDICKSRSAQLSEHMHDRQQDDSAPPEIFSPHKKVSQQDD